MKEDPLEVPIFVGAKIILTKNLNKQIGFVNRHGCHCAGNGWQQCGSSNRTRSSPHGPSMDVSGVQGALPLSAWIRQHSPQVWLDVPNMPAAAYVALSRVEYDSTWQFVGDPTVHHFTPARSH